MRLPTPPPNSTIFSNLKRDKMTVEQLLVPRYEQTKDYPNQTTKKGDILTFVGCFGEENQFIEYINQNGEIFHTEWLLDAFPDIFRPLAWHERRNRKDMPDYLKKGSSVISVLGYQFSDKENTKLFVKWLHDGKSRRFKIGTLRAAPISEFLPATKSDYDNYINSTTNK